jgi:hypothetical protein
MSFFAIQFSRSSRPFWDGLILRNIFTLQIQTGFVS